MGPLPKSLAAYDKLIPAVLERTVQGVDAEGLAGLMTFGVYPRYWGEPGSPGEIDCQDPTRRPARTGTTPSGAAPGPTTTTRWPTAAIWAMRSGEVEWLDELAFPGALRTLHTQIMQCAPGDPWFYCGQAPTGYGAYRADFNSSHAYFENLFLYYWLTGDSTVVDVVRRGADSMRRLVCPDRGAAPVTVARLPDGPPCSATHPPDNPSSLFTGRVAGQWAAAYRFLGLASEDPSFLEDYRSSLARALTQSLHGARAGRQALRLPERGGRQGGRAVPRKWDRPGRSASTTPRTSTAGSSTPATRRSASRRFLPAACWRRWHGAWWRSKAPVPRRPWRPPGHACSSSPRAARGSAGTLLKIEPKDRDLYDPEKYGTVALLLRSRPAERGPRPDRGGPGAGGADPGAARERDPPGQDPGPDPDPPPRRRGPGSPLGGQGRKPQINRQRSCTIARPCKPAARGFQSPCVQSRRRSRSARPLRHGCSRGAPSSASASSSAWRWASSPAW